jgi:serine/threonine protein kinase
VSGRVTARSYDATIALLESVPPALDAARSGRYEVQYPIGAGGHAEVLLAVVQGADGFRRPVAIKRVRSDLPNQRPLVATLIEEAHQTAQLSHPNVVSVLDFNRDPQGRPYLVMEYVDGIDLDTLVGTAPLPHSVAIFIARELLGGLGYIHQSRGRGRGRVSGLIHRDIKPSNVLLSWEGAVKLTDFGLARMFQRTRSAHAIEGTPGYMSPEQARREHLDARADLYAVGIVLWELLAHQRLRVGLTGDDKAETSFHAIRRPSEYRRNVPADLEAVAMRLLAYDREARYRTAELTAHDLMCCQEAPRDGRGELARLLDERFPRSHRPDPLSRPLKLGPPNTRPRTVTELSTPMYTPLLPQPREPGDVQRRPGTMERASRRRWWWALACGVLLVLALAAALALVVAR